MIRLYFNKDGSLPWSVDEGPNTKEFQTDKVYLVGAFGEVHYDPQAGDNITTPTAWIEFEDAELHIADDESVVIMR